MLKQLLVILNPHSGNGNAPEALKKLEAEAKSQDCQLDVLSTDHAGHATELIQNHSLKGVDALISIGGDGTLNEVVNGYMKRDEPPKIPLGILPSGTGNSLMQDLGCRTPEDALKDIFSGKRSMLDVFKVEMDGSVHYGVNMIGCGLPASVNNYAEASRVFKRQRYNVGALKAILHYKPVGYTFRSDEMEEEVLSDFIIASNTRYIGSGIQIAPDARLDDGLLDIVLLKPFNRLSLFPLFYKLLKGRHMQDPKVITKRLNNLSVSAPSKKLLNIDGDQHEFQNLRVDVLPRSIMLLHEPPTR